MFTSARSAAWLVLLSSTLLGQQPAGPTAQPYQPMVIHRIDLVPTGSVFSMDEPKLEGETWVFHILPERTLERLPKARVKQITRRTRDFEKEVIFRVEFEPTGQMLSWEEPVKKGSNYVLKSWKGGTLLSVGQADVKKITRLTGMEAFRAEEEELGVVLLEGEVNFRKDTPEAPASGTVARPGDVPKAPEPPRPPN